MATPSHSTPIAPIASLAIKVCSTRFSNSNGCISVKTLDSLLAKELTGGMVSKTSTHIDFTLNEYIPFTVDNNLLQSLTAVYANNAWISRPTGVGQESEVAEWMNNIGDDLARKLPNGPRLLRKWSAQNANTSLAGSSVERKPDIILVDHDSASPYFWQNVRGLTEVTSQPTFHARIRNTIYQKSFLMFTSQPDRRIVLSLALFGKGFVFTACDRAGVIHSETLSYNECALTLLSLLAIFMFGTEESIGYDTTMRRGPDDNIKAITVAGDDYTVLRKIYSAETLRGRATQCWHVKKDGQEFAIKDSWVHLGRSSNEINILKKIEGVRDTPALHVGEDVKLSSGKVDSTALLRQGHDYKEHRCHRRLVMTPVGAPIFTFTSRKELIGAFRNIVQAHKTLCEEKHILHRDISHNNLMLYADGGGLRRGLLIDYDYAAELEGDSDHSVDTERTGTGPYMAVELLDSTDPTLKQNSAHDLESIFYVLLFICSQYKGPNDQLRQPEDLKEISMPIATWFEPHHRLRDLGDKKRAHLDDIQRRLISKFSTYFTPLGKTISDIFFDVLFPQDPTSRPSADKKWCCSATHSKFLAVLDHILEPGAGLDQNEPTPGTKKRSDLSDPSGSDGIEGSTKCPRLSGDMVKAVPPLRRSTRKRATQTTGAGSSTVKGTTGGGSQGK